jgi:hypothetical protein
MKEEIVQTDPHLGIGLPTETFAGFHSFNLIGN